MLFKYIGRLCSAFIVIFFTFANLGFHSHQAHAAPKAELFGQLPDLYDAALSPDGQSLAVIINKDGEYLIGIYDLDNEGSKPRVVGLGKDVKPSYTKWANNEQVIISLWQSAKLQGTPIRMAVLYSLNSKTLEGKILVDPNKVRSNDSGTRLGNKGIFRQFNNVVVDWLEDDPDHILMAYSNDNNNNLRPDIRKVHVVTGRDKVIRGGTLNVQFWKTDNTGTPRIGQGRKDDNKADWVLKIKDADSDKWRLSDEYPGLRADVNIFGFTNNPNEMIINDYNGKDTLGLYIYDLSQKTITRKLYHNEKYDASGVVLSKDGGEVIGAKYTADTPQTEMIDGHDTLLQSIRRKNPNHIIDFIDQSDDGQTLIFKMSNAYDPGAMLITKAGQEVPRILGFMRPDLPSASLGEVIPVSYKARDGYKIPSYVTLPPMVTETSMIKNLPFIVLPHGGPYGRDSKRFDYFAQFFATRGYGVFQMNFRGSEGFGKSYEEAGRQNWEIMQEDVEDGTRWLFKKGYADPKRTCIAGWSYGGYAALMGAAKNPDLYNCSIAMAALTDINSFKRNLLRYRFGKASAKNFIGKGFSDKDDVKANSPVKIAEDMTVPLFLAHGTLDQQVHFSQYKRMKNALKKSSADVTFMEFKDEDHYLSNQDNRMTFFKGLDKFLTKHNGPSEYMSAK